MARDHRSPWAGLLALVAVLIVHGPAGCSTDSQNTNEQANATDDNNNDNTQNEQANGSDEMNENSAEICASEDRNATINIAGTYRYSGGGANAITEQTFSFSGTITFEQEGNMVRVSDTTYDSVGLRRVAGEFVELLGNEFETTLTPIGGDTSYAAQVRFVFDEDGNSFCVEFMDSNNDMGELGSFTGLRTAAGPGL